MKLHGFRVHNFRNISDSGWVDVDDLTAFIGQNEAGKTALLDALHKLNPAHPTPHNVQRDWPRFKRASLNRDGTVLQAKFALNDDQIKELTAINDNSTPDKFVFAVQNYGSRIVFRTSDRVQTSTLDHSALKQRVLELFQPVGEVSDHFGETLTEMAAQARAVVDAVTELTMPDIQSLSENVPPLRDRAMYGTDYATHNRLVDGLAHATEIIKDKVHDFTPQAERMLLDWMPKLHLIESDIHKPFHDKVDLVELAQRLENDSPDMNSLLWAKLFDMAGLDLAEEVEKVTQAEQEQRIFDFGDASTRLNKVVKNYWAQSEYVLQLRPEGTEVTLFTSKRDTDENLRFGEHSDGYRHAFILNLTLAYYLKKHPSIILLLDEPNAYLQHIPQLDLCKRLTEHSKYAHFIYATNSPFMLNTDALNSIRVLLTRDQTRGTEVVNYTALENAVESDQSAAFLVHAALQSQPRDKQTPIAVGSPTLYVESLVEFWIISSIANVFRTSEFESLHESIIIVPMSDSTGSPPTEQNKLMLISKAGQTTPAAIDANAITYAEVVEQAGDIQVEDLLSPELYLEFVNKSHADEMSFTHIIPSKLTEFETIPNITERTEHAARKTINNPQFVLDRQKCAHAMFDALSKYKVAELPLDTVKNFLALFTKVNRTLLGE